MRDCLPAGNEGTAFAGVEGLRVRVAKGLLHTCCCAAHTSVNKHLLVFVKCLVHGSCGRASGWLGSSLAMGSMGLSGRVQPELSVLSD